MQAIKILNIPLSESEYCQVAKFKKKQSYTSWRALLIGIAQEGLN